MATQTFDTHATIKSLQDSGADESLAKAIVSAIQTGTGHLSDLAAKAKPGNCVTETDLEILRLRMIARVWLTALAVSVVAIAAAKLL